MNKQKMKIDGRDYEVLEKSQHDIKVRSCKPIVSPDEKKKRSEYITRRCADILKIHG